MMGGRCEFSLNNAIKYFFAQVVDPAGSTEAQLRKQLYHMTAVHFYYGTKQFCAPSPH